MTLSIYTTPKCKYCHKAIDRFKEMGLPFDEFNVAENEIRRNEMIELTGQLGVPVIKLDDEVMVGWDSKEFDKMVGASIDQQATQWIKDNL